MRSLAPMSVRRVVVVLTAGLALSGLTAGGNAGTATSADPWHGWTRLRLKAHAALVLTGRVEMRRHTGSDTRLFETSTTARFLGALLARNRTRTVIDMATGHTEEYENLSAKRGRYYVFGDEGYTMSKLKPSNGFAAPRKQWAVESTREFSYPRTESGDRAIRVSDYYGMLYGLRRLGLERQGDEAEVFVATSRGPRGYRVGVARERQGSRTFTDLSSGKKRTVATHELMLTITPADPEEAKGFLGMTGQTEIWVEAKTKTVLSIRGKVPKVPGHVTLVINGLR